MAETEGELRAYHISKIDCFAQLAAWEAPWHRCTLEISSLEDLWSIEEIERMVSERASHPDYKSGCTIPYPNRGWLSQLLVATQPEFMMTQTLAMVVNNMASGLGHEFKIMLDELSEEEKGERSQAKQLLQDAIEAFSNYTPDSIDAKDEKGKELFLRVRNTLISTMKLSLAIMLSGDGDEDAAEEQYPGITEPHELINSNRISGRIQQLIEEAQQTADYLNEKAGIVEAQAKQKRPPETETETETDTNPLHLIYKANRALLAKDCPLEKVEVELEKALSMLGMPRNDQQGRPEESSLLAAAASYIKTPYIVKNSMHLEFAGLGLLRRRRFDLAMRMLLLKDAIDGLESGEDSPPSFNRDTDKMLLDQSLGLCHLGLGDFENAEEHLSRASLTAHYRSVARDITGRLVPSGQRITIDLLLWIVASRSKNSASPESLWQKIKTVESTEFSPGVLEYLKNFLYEDNFDLAVPVMARYQKDETGEPGQNRLELVRELRRTIYADRSKLKKLLFYLKAEGHIDLYGLFEEE